MVVVVVVVVAAAAAAKKKKKTTTTTTKKKTRWRSERAVAENKRREFATESEGTREEKALSFGGRCSLRTISA